MTDTEKLSSMIDRSGYKKSYIAKTLGITRAALYKKLSNHSEFKASEINELCKILGITSLKEKESIFFAEQVAKTATQN